MENKTLFDLASQKTPVIGSRNVTGLETPGTRAKVYFSRFPDAAHLIQLYTRINEHIYGKTVIKLHTGEPHGPNIVPPEWVKQLQDQVPDSTIAECDTLYMGQRHTPAEHRKTLEINGWNFSKVDILDEDGGIPFPVRNGFHHKEIEMGSHLLNYDSLIVLTHFKGHAMGGFGGSLKNIAIGCASGNIGKAQVHLVDPGNLVHDYGNWPMKEPFMESMVDSGMAICDYFGKRIVFINVMRKMSVDCDCTGTAALPPTIPDIGICASTDILAIDQASCDLMWSLPESENHDLVERIMSRAGLRQLSAMREHKMGNPQYELISID